MTRASTRRERAAREAWLAMSDLVLDNERRRHVSDQLGLSFGKIRTLRRIAKRPMPMRELAALVGVDPPNLTMVVDDLERSGLVERHAHPTDRRIKLVAATASGLALAKRAQEMLEKPPVGVFELPLDDLEILGQILSRTRRDQEPGR
jgi:DNA-binding MarR family transcriptional regulator